MAFVDCLANRLTETNLPLLTVHGILGKQLGTSRFQKKYDSRAAEEEFSFFRSSLEGAYAMVVLNLSHQECTYLDLGYDTEVIRMQEGVFPAVLVKNGHSAHSDGAHCVQFSGEKIVFCFVATVDVVVSVIVIDAKPDHQTSAALVSLRLGITAQQLLQAIGSAFDGKFCVRGDGVGAEQTVTGSNQRLGIVIHRACIVRQFTCEKIVETVECLFLTLGQIYMVFLYKTGNVAFRKTGIQVATCQSGYPRRGEPL